MLVEIHGPSGSLLIFRAIFGDCPSQSSKLEVAAAWREQQPSAPRWHSLGYGDSLWHRSLDETSDYKPKTVRRVVSSNTGVLYP